MFISIKRTALFAVIFFTTFKVFAQTAPPQDLVTIEQNFKKLDVLGSVLYVAAHPDDENTRLLAYLAQEKHYRTGYLSMTRGDGGQNLIGNEQGELLGLIRTQELLAARRVDGAEQFFTRTNDFGFSKGPEETLNFWNKEKALGDVVWVIRKFRPDVIICRFPTTGEGGHGNHTASAILAQEAFSAAADPKRFPEQLKYVQVWQAKRLLWNTFSFGSVNTTSENQFHINVGVYNPVLGKGYGEMAAESRSNHKTQGFGSARQRGDAYEYFKTILGDAPKNDLMDGVNTTWERVGNQAIGNNIEAINKNLEPEHPEKSVSKLVGLLGRIDKVPDAYWKAQKTKELSELIAACAGLWVEAYAAEPVYAVGDKVTVNTQMILRSKIEVKYKEKFFSVEDMPMQMVIDAPPANLNSAQKGPDTLRNEISSANTLFMADSVTQPYWLKYPHPIGSYNVDYLEARANAKQRSLPENIASPFGFKFQIIGHTIDLQRDIVYKHTDPARGELYEPLVIAPPVTANIAGKDYIFNSQKPQMVQVKLQSFKEGASGSIHLNAPAGWQISPDKIDFADKVKGSEWEEEFTVTPTTTKSQTSVLEAQVTMSGDPKVYNYGILSIHYNHIPNITLFPPAQSKLLNIDLKIAGKRIGYIPGAGDQMQDALRQVGYDVHQLTDNEILNSDLSVYDAIVVGVRAYNVDERLAVDQPKLMDYVKNGGNLLVQYNNNSGLVTSQIGPYPFRVVNERVTDETAKVTITNPGSPLLNYPNKITDADFDGWIQERGLYYVRDIAPQYQTVFKMNDPGEAPKEGSLITTNYGKGRFVYTSLAFFRQLPAGVPGAYRLFINLLSKPE